MPPTNEVSAYLRAHKADIVERWCERVTTHLPVLARLDRASLIDHLPEFLDGLADWIEGETDAARTAFGALAIGHAIQRLGHGVDLATLTREYALLRRTILEALLVLDTTATLRTSLLVLNEGLDVAGYAAVERYTEARDEVRDRFVGMLAHDLRNPLDAITLGAGRLTETPPAEKAERIANTIVRSADRMARMIDDVMEFARGQLGGSVPIFLTPGDLGEIAREAVDELVVAHPDRKVAMTTHGDLRGRWDRDRVLQLVSNLVANALTHGQDPIAVHVDETPSGTAPINASGGRALVLRVNNQGVIDAERLAHLFDPLRREARKSRRGLGLGLYIVRQIALAHGATCSVSSTASEGTTFVVTWPCAKPAG
ncbi:MAG TPA: HAMP domain-containing sensor histidine kinase [Kofleriaceae bacterium]|nr:HAMP domain-containing sensor histidine kinase [Kofleriaceae bacterium]